MIALIVAVYILMEKQALYRQFRMAAYVFFPRKIAASAGKLWRILYTTYAKFLAGQCLEACILGLLMLTAFLLFRFPYAGLIAAATALFSFIPYLGSFLSCVIGALLILIINPLQAAVFIIVYQIVQFIENQFIYPHVVGGSVGLPAFWTLIAVLLGGKTAGFIGMLFSIPLASVIYSLLGEKIRSRLGEKRMAPPSSPEGS